MAIGDLSARTQLHTDDVYSFCDGLDVAFFSKSMHMDIHRKSFWSSWAGHHRCQHCMASMATMTAAAAVPHGALASCFQRNSSGSASRLQGGAQLPTQPRSRGSPEAAIARVEDPLLYWPCLVSASWGPDASQGIWALAQEWSGLAV